MALICETDGWACRLFEGKVQRASGMPLFVLSGGGTKRLGLRRTGFQLESHATQKKVNLIFTDDVSSDVALAVSRGFGELRKFAISTFAAGSGFQVGLWGAYPWRNGTGLMNGCSVEPISISGV